MARWKHLIVNARSDTSTISEGDLVLKQLAESPRRRGRWFWLWVAAAVLFAALASGVLSVSSYWSESQWNSGITQFTEERRRPVLPARNRRVQVQVEGDTALNRHLATQLQKELNATGEFESVIVDSGPASGDAGLLRVRANDDDAWWWLVHASGEARVEYVFCSWCSGEMEFQSPISSLPATAPRTEDVLIASANGACDMSCTAWGVIPLSQWRGLLVDQAARDIAQKLAANQRKLRDQE